MKTLAAIVIAWFMVLLVGLAGMFSAQPGLMSICFFAWTPLAIAFGYHWRRAGLRIVTETKPEPRITSVEQPIKRVRRIEG